MVRWVDVPSVDSSLFFPYDVFFFFSRRYSISYVGEVFLIPVDLGQCRSRRVGFVECYRHMVHLGGRLGGSVACMFFWVGIIMGRIVFFGHCNFDP